MTSVMIASRGRSIGEWHSSHHYQKMEIFGFAKTPSLTIIAKDHLVLELYEADIDIPN